MLEHLVDTSVETSGLPLPVGFHRYECQRTSQKSDVLTSGDFGTHLPDFLDNTADDKHVVSVDMLHHGVFPHLLHYEVFVHIENENYFDRDTLVAVEGLYCICFLVGFFCCLVLNPSKRSHYLQR